MRSKRSKWKFNYVHQDLFHNFFLSDKKRLLKSQSRSSSIIPIFNSMEISIHNGFEYTLLKFHSSMMGHKCGEFVETRSIFRYGKK